MFREQDHPRDEDGKFTFKNGGVEKIPKTPTQVLYSNSTKQKELKEKEAKHKSKLLDILGDKATPADVLYADTDKLERKIKEFGLMTGGASSAVSSNTTTNPKFIKPVDGVIRSNFGPRKAPVPGASTFHGGLDLRAPVGTPVKSITSGKVIKAGAASGYGIAVYIDHGIINGKRVTSEYGHLSKCNVKVGDKIAPGQIVAKSGNTGCSQAPHLHITIREDGKAVDPKKYLKY